MLSKPIQFLLLAPIVFGTIAPRFFLLMFAAGLALLGLKWLAAVLDILQGK